MALGIPVAARPKPKISPPQTQRTKTAGADAILHFAKTCETLSKTESHTKQVDIIAQYFSSLPVSEIATACLFLAGQIFPKASRRQIRVDAKLNKQAILFAANSTETDYKNRKLEHADPQIACLLYTSPSHET